ncbi:MAG: hypothetical protein IKL53_02280 [Lachnospiraceae bacterium]|nr:hypothetical protein [Lachnospiraceae bacterium]
MAGKGNAAYSPEDGAALIPIMDETINAVCNMMEQVEAVKKEINNSYGECESKDEVDNLFKQVDACKDGVNETIMALNGSVETLIDAINASTNANIQRSQEAVAAAAKVAKQAGEKAGTIRSNLK